MPPSATQLERLAGTGTSRQGYLPDLEPILRGSIRSLELGRSLLLPKSKSSPACSPSVVGSNPTLPRNESASSKVAVALGSGPVVASEASTSSSLWPTVFSMCSATLGAGALSLPYAFAQVGAAGGVCMLLVTAAASHYSVVLLVSAITQSGTRSYEELTVSLFGKWLGVVVELNIVIFCFGSIIAYTVALGDLLHPFIEPLGFDQRSATCFFWAVLMLPLSMFERISSLQWPSLFGVLSVFYLVLSVVAHAAACAVQEASAGTHFKALPTASAITTTLRSPKSDDGWDLSDFLGAADGVKLWAWGPGSLEAASIMMHAHGRRSNSLLVYCHATDEQTVLSRPCGQAVLSSPLARGRFAFTCQVNVPALYMELPERSPTNYNKVSARAMGICLACYLLVGFAGYRDAPEAGSGNLLKNYCVLPTGNGLAGSHRSSHLMLPAYLAMAVSVLMAYPFNSQSPL